MDDRKADRRKSAARPRKKRRLLKASLTLGLVAVALVAGLPWLLGTPPGRAFVVNEVNARLAPGSIRLGGLGLAWNGPATLNGVALVDPKGKTVLAADRLTLDKGVLGLIASRPDYGTITIEGATVDLERKADGSVDLFDALATLMKPDPLEPKPPVQMPAPAPAPNPAPAPARPAPSLMSVTVVIKSGKFKLAAPELVEPIAARSLEGSLTIAPGKPMEVSATLGDEGRSLQVRSTEDPGGDLGLSVVARDWPIHVRQSGVEAKGRLVGDLAARRDQGLWSAKGDAAIVEVAADGPALRGDRLKLDRVAATCDLGQAAGGWAIRKFEFTSPVATLNGSGTIPALDGKPAEIRGKVDLAALAVMLPNALRLKDNLTLDRGSATIRVDVTAAEGVDRAELVASLDDFAAIEGGREVRLRQPVYLAVKANRAGKKVTVERLEVKAAGVDVNAGGDLEAGVRLGGTVDLVALTAQLRDVLDLGKLDLSGHARVAADYRHLADSYKGRFAVEFKDLKVVGATAGPIVHDSARLDGWAVGQARTDGTPEGWQQARLDLKAGDVKLDAQASTTGSETSLVAAFEMAVASPVAGRFEAKAKLRKLGTSIEVDELVAGITPTDPAAASGVVALGLKGRFDPASGEGSFAPIPGQGVAAIGLGPDGVTLSGVGRAGVPMKVEAALYGDLGLLDRVLASWNGAPPKGLGGLWAIQMSAARSVAGKLDVDAKAFVPDLANSTGSKGPVSLAVKASYSAELDRLDVPSLVLASKLGRVSVVAGVAEVTARRFFDVTANLEPAWAAIDPLVASSVEPDAHIRATFRPVHLDGQFRADSAAQLLNQVAGEVGLDLTEARAFGVTLGATPVVLKIGGGSMKFDPIRTTMNDGPVSIVADLALDGDAGVWLRVGASKVEGAAINEAVSNSILAYVAPVLAKSTGVTGKVTVEVGRAFVPITAKGSMTLDGAMALQDVAFRPGPLGAELSSITGKGISDLKLNQAMFVRVHDGRVEQSGLSIPLGINGLAVAIDGSVGFDETLDLKATIPIAVKVPGLDSGPGEPASTVALPIGGTLSRPAVDRKALAVALRQSVKAVGEKRLKAEAGRLLDRIAGPNQPSGEPRARPANKNPLGDLENLGRELLDPKKP